MLTWKKNNSGELKFLNLTDICPNPRQPRTRFGKAELDALTESVRQCGVLQPITVTSRNGGYQLIAGERRLRAAEQAGLAKIPSLVIKAGDSAGAMLALVENEQREDLHFFEEAEAIATLINRYGFSQEAVAGAIGKNQSTVANKLRLLRLPTGVRTQIREAKMTERHARALLSLPDETTMNAVLEQVKEQGLTVKETEELVEKTMLSSPNAGRKTTERRRFCFLLRDYKPLFNTIRKTVAEMKRSGVDARYTESQNEAGDTVITLVLPNQEQKTPCV